MNRRQWLLSTGTLLVAPPSLLAFSSKPTLWEYDFRMNPLAYYKTISLAPENRHLGYLLFSYKYNWTEENSFRYRVIKISVGWNLNPDGTIVKEPFLQFANGMRSEQLQLQGKFTNTKWYLQVAADKYAEIDLDNGGILIY